MMRIRVPAIPERSEEAPGLTIETHGDGGYRAWALAQDGAAPEGAAQALRIRLHLQAHGCQTTSSAATLQPGRLLGLQDGTPPCTRRSISAWPADRARAATRTFGLGSATIGNSTGEAVVCCWGETFSHGAVILPLAQGAIPRAVALARRVLHLGVSVAATDGAVLIAGLTAGATLGVMAASCLDQLAQPLRTQSGGFLAGPTPTMDTAERWADWSSPHTETRTSGWQIHAGAGDADKIRRAVVAATGTPAEVYFADCLDPRSRRYTPMAVIHTQGRHAHRMEALITRVPPYVSEAWTRKLPFTHARTGYHRPATQPSEA